MKILCATDLQPGASAVIGRASWLARKLGGRLTVLHVVPPEEPRGLALEQRVWRADAHLRARVSEEADKPQVRVRVGNPARRVVESIDESRPDLVVLGPRTTPGDSPLFHRGIAERVLDETRRPVLVVRNEPQSEYGSVMVALDLTEESAGALKLTERLSFAGEEIACAVHAYHPPYDGMMASVGVRPEKIETHAEAWRRDFASGVREFLRRHSKDPWRYRLIMAEDRPVRGILAVTEQVQPDLLVVGTRTQGALLRTLLGSVGRKVADAASCDVLLVPGGAAAPTGTAA
ncbi:MAG TPA: universal stress protein [Steroidobacteraceae bacterium]|nr:universal stress protein [Steroidobacteraceae bacterium]